MDLRYKEMYGLSGTWIIKACDAAGGEFVAVIPNRGHDLTITRPLEVVGNAAWYATQLRARGVRVVEVNGDSWRHLSRRERAIHLQELLSPFTVH